MFRLDCPAYGRRVAVLWRCVLAALLALALPGAAMAQAAPTHITAELIAEAPARPARPGGPATLALLMRPAPGWHGYWLQPGDAGFPMRLSWHLPKGTSVGSPRYPVPHTLLIAGLMNHVYEQDYAVLVDLHLPDSAMPGSLPVSVSAQWLACSATVCVPEQAELATSIAIAAPGAPARIDPRFDQWRARLPAPLGGVAHFALDSGALRLAIPLPASVPLSAPHVFVASDGVVDPAAPQAFARAGDVLLVRLARAKFAPASPASLDAVLALNLAGEGLSLTATPGLVPSGGMPLAEAGPAPLPSLGQPSLAMLLLAALAGGLLLNVMPCVFPILSLKALSLARAGESPAQARAEGLAYSAGVVLACMGLGGLLLALRAAGHEIGWAFQLQEPGVVVALLALCVVITANLAGLFEFSVPGFAQAGGARNSAFATGLLAAFVATPCTGPFMAGAMGAALLLPIGAALALFAALGLGIALPFLAIAFVSPLRAMLPRPGAWMGWFRKAMALPLGLTTLALLWLTSRLGGTGFAIACAGFSVVLVAVLGWLGAGQRRGKAMARPVGLGLLTLGVVAALALPHGFHPASVRVADSAEVLPSQPFSPAALDATRASGHPVFAYFTADWCLTCKLNERLAIERETTRAAFARAGVVVLKGDWTRRDPVITRYLASMGAAGVPLYVWYPAGGGQQEAPRQLPQILDPELLSDLPKENLTKKTSQPGN